MNENKKTIALLSIAVVVVLVAWLSRPGEWSGDAEQGDRRETYRRFRSLGCRQVWKSSNMTNLPRRCILSRFRWPITKALVAGRSLRTAIIQPMPTSKWPVQRPR